MGKVARADVAAVCIAALSNPKVQNVTFELRSNLSTASGPDDLARLFDGLQLGNYE